jgi:hypothetical protein
VQRAARPEGWHRLRVDRHCFAGPRVAADPSLPLLDGEGAEAAQLHPVATRQGGGDLIEDRRHDPFNVCLAKVRVAGGEFRDQVRSGHASSAVRPNWPISYHQNRGNAVMDQDDRSELLDLATRAFHELRQSMSEADAVRILFNTIVLGEGEPPWPLTSDQVQRVQDVLEEMRRLLDEPLLRH